MEPSSASPCRALFRLRTGFTLIELLVVIGVVAVLASLLMPVLSRVQETSNSVKCISNLKQIGTGIYAVINDGTPVLGQGYYPPVDYHDANYKYGTWYLLVADKLGLTQPAKDSSWTMDLQSNAKIFVCPDNKIPVSKQLGPGGDAYNNISYSYDDSPLGSTVTADSGSIYGNNIKVALMEKASTTIMVSDSNGDGFFDCLINDWGKNSTCPGNRHNGYTNVLFCDGHTEHVPFANIAWGPIMGPGRNGFYVTTAPASPTP